LSQLKENYDYSVYLAIHPTLIGKNMSTKALNYRDQWFAPDEDGLIITFNSDNSGVFLAVAHPPGKTNPANRNLSFLVEDHEAFQLVKRLQKNQDSQQGSSAYIINFSHQLCAELTTLLEAKKAPVQNLNATLIVTIILSAALVLGMTLLAVRHQQAAYAKDPEHPITPRLGAAFGGSQGWQIDFKLHSDKDS